MAAKKKMGEWKKHNKEKSVLVGMEQGFTVDQSIDAIEFEERMERRIAEDADVLSP